MLELIAVMELWVVWRAIDPHFVNDFEPAVAQAAQGVGVALILLAVKLVITLCPHTLGQTLVRKKMEGVTQVFVTSPALMTVAAFTRTFGYRGGSRQAL